ncbi:hypothetical protein [Alicyclobacillus sp. SP_1]|uniref:hypothetical protein n=1 Tax=Alicyclobacillus sp. SP_1 TaxID=2942475 RepID=UPI002157CEBE|nr:hypothetical protein [Alicyclobacillus sp. SP_1]
MPCFITFRTININAPSQNAGAFVGEVTIPGWDANSKSNYGHAAIHGFSNFEAATVNVTMDGQEFVDSAIADSDFKPVWGKNL